MEGKTVYSENMNRYYMNTSIPGVYMFPKIREKSIIKGICR